MAKKVGVSALPMARSGIGTKDMRRSRVESASEDNPMNLVSWLQRLMTTFGAGWVMWLLVVLSVLSVAVMLERGWFYWSLRDDLAKLAHDLRERLRSNDITGAKKRLEASPSAEAAVVTAGLLRPIEARKRPKRRCRAQPHCNG
ncbi:MAG: hypothetical protein U0263_10105 [Polyangiaceae bacterium]